MEIIKDWQKQDKEKLYREYFSEYPSDEEVPDQIKYLDLENIPQPDFAHQSHHIETVRNYARCMAQTAGLSKYWQEKIDFAAQYHDMTNGLVHILKATRSEHAVLASFLVYMMTHDREVAELVYMHDNDSFDLSTEDGDSSFDTAAKVLRDADQVALMGYSGLIRAAWYWGYRHPEMFYSPEEVISRVNVCDTRCNYEGLPTDFDANVEQLCLDNFFHFAINQNLLKNIVEHTKTNIKRYFGEKKSEYKFLQVLSYDKETLRLAEEGTIVKSIWELGKSLWYTIDPISPKYGHKFIRKILKDYEILQIAEYLLSEQERFPNIDLHTDLPKAIRSAKHNSVLM